MIRQSNSNALWKILKNNKYFFGGYLFLFLIGLIILSQITWGDENLYFVRFRESFLDTVFSYLTLLAEPVVISFLLGYLLFRNYRKTLSLLTTLALSLLVVWLGKDYFAHPRPALFFRELGRLDELISVEGADILTGHTSFPSGHTLVGFAIFTLFALYSKQKSISGVFFLLLAVSVAISRVYLGHHFLKDVLAGSIAGVIISVVVFLLFEKLSHRPKWNKGLFSKN